MLRNSVNRILPALLAGLALVLTACGGGGGGASSGNAARSATITVSASISGVPGAGGLVLHDSAGDDIVVAADGSYDFPTLLATGDNYSVTVQTQPSGSYCTVSNGSGQVGATNIVIGIRCVAAAHFAYVANYGSNTISGYSIDAASGALTAIPGSPFAAGQGPQDIGISPDGRFVYAVNYQDNTVWTYAANAATGALVATGNTAATGNSPWAIAIDPTGSYAYVTDSMDNTVSAYAIDAATGALSELSSSPYVTEVEPEGIRIDPTGKYVYIANADDDDLSGFAIDAASGALTPLSSGPFRVGSGVQSLSINAGGNLLFAVNGNDGTLTGFALDPASGALSPLPQGAVVPNGNPGMFAITPDGKYAFVTDYSTPSGAVLGYTIDGSGALTDMAAPFAAGDAPWALTVDPGSRFVYVANEYGGTVSAYSIDPASGALVPLSSGPVSSGSYPTAIVVK